ncbi:ABC transporter permease [Sulfidibacter corallicola]|uniref:ABC transporter permease n=1 Tax=Sulfidibacter corallicola TaxID=2818388 RepID=A0A8A4TVC5_SULCO|nr:ABC transporter permease [Sulfidibacter corallicola]QTD53433.1 ABC transporter permease [Sulfidibacter corallicola]
MDALIQDLRFAVRMLRKSPKFTVIAIVCLSLGVGPNTAIFSVIDTLLLRPVDVARQHELVSIRTTIKGEVGEFSELISLSHPDYVDIRDRTDLFSGLIAYSGSEVAVKLPGGMTTSYGSLVSANFFDVLGRDAVVGDTFHGNPRATPGTMPVVVLGHGFWTKNFGADPDVVGRHLWVNGFEFTVIGVMGPGFTGATIALQPDMWIPLPMCAQAIPNQPQRLNRRDQLWLNVVGRLKKGADLVEVDTRLGTLGETLAAENPDEIMERGFTSAPFSQLGELSLVPVGGLIAMVMGLVGLVLLVACFNVAALLLARTTERRREISVRVAMGATRGRLIRQLLVESALLSFVATLFGLILSLWTLDLVRSLLANMPIHIVVDTGLDWRMLLFSLFVTIVSTLVFGLAPALHHTKLDIVSHLKSQGADAGSNRATSRLRAVFVVMQVATSVFMLIVATLLWRGLQRAGNIDPGFDIDHTAVFHLDPELYGFDIDEVGELGTDLTLRLANHPDVEGAAHGHMAPFDMNYSVTSVQAIDENLGTGEPIRTLKNSIAPGFLETLEIPLLEGRYFLASDRLDRPRSCIVNRELADRLWPGESAVGRQIMPAGGEESIEVVGVVPTGKYQTLGERDQPYLYYPLQPRFEHGLSFILRTTRRTASDEVTAGMRAFLEKEHPEMVFSSLVSMRDHISTILWPNKIGAALFAGLGLLALVLATAGVFGMVSHEIRQRRGEIGIRLALGGSPETIMALLLWHGFRLVGIGIAVGIAAAWGTTHFLTMILNGVSPTDPLSFVAPTLLLVGAAGLAVFQPARKAANRDPMEALRYE